MPWWEDLNLTASMSNADSLRSVNTLFYHGFIFNDKSAKMDDKSAKILIRAVRVQIETFEK
jgi:hypothetical protein